jgi:hypothetical protein
MRLAGATVLRGPMGFGHSSHLHTTKVLRLSQDLPLVIEIVDVEDKIKAFLAAIEPIMGNALITTEKVKVIRYGNQAGRCRLVAASFPAQLRKPLEPLLQLGLVAVSRGRVEGLTLHPVGKIVLT